ncbi:MAG TPA: hypothetical protein PLF31_02405 [Candidatus Paceibacterota bacterium]|nr:hypothetical protein [Candidatus Paceibacterota bacterium]
MHDRRKQSVLVSRRFQEKKRKHTTWVRIVLFGLTVVAVSSAISVFFIPIFNISNVRVDFGAQENTVSKSVTQDIEFKLLAMVNEAMTKPRAFFLPASSIFFNRASNWQQALENTDPRLKDLEVDSKNRELIIKPVVRKPYGSWCGSGWCVSVDTEGVVLGSQAAVAPSMKTEVADLVVNDEAPVRLLRKDGGDGAPDPGEPYLDPQVFTDTLAFAGEMKREQFDAETLIVDGKSSIGQIEGELVSVSGQRVMFMLSNKEGYAETIKYFQLFKAQIRKVGFVLSDYEYIDLRFGNAVYYKKKNSVSNTEEEITVQ